MKSLVLIISVALLLVLPSSAESVGSERRGEPAGSFKDLYRSVERQAYLTPEMKGDVDCDSDC